MTESQITPVTRQINRAHPGLALLEIEEKADQMLRTEVTPVEMDLPRRSFVRD